MAPKSDAAAREFVDRWSSPEDISSRLGESPAPETEDLIAALLEGESVEVSFPPEVAKLVNERSAKFEFDGFDEESLRWTSSGGDLVYTSRLGKEPLGALVVGDQLLVFEASATTHQTTWKVIGRDSLRPEGDPDELHDVRAQPDIPTEGLPNKLRGMRSADQLNVLIVFTELATPYVEAKASESTLTAFARHTKHDLRDAMDGLLEDGQVQVRAVKLAGVRGSSYLEQDKTMHEIRKDLVRAVSWQGLANDDPALSLGKELHALRHDRRNNSPDVVVLIAGYRFVRADETRPDKRGNPTKPCGLATGILRPSDPQNVVGYDTALAVVGDLCVHEGYSIVHEIGHLLGAAHEKSSKTRPGSHPNAFANAACGNATTVMGYVPASCGGERRLLEFSKYPTAHNHRALGDNLSSAMVWGLAYQAFHPKN